MQYIHADGKAAPIFVKEEHWEMIREAETNFLECFPYKIVKFGGDILHLQSRVFENDTCFKILKSWEEEYNKMCKELLGGKEEVVETRGW